MKNPLRLNAALIESARLEAAIRRRSVPNQIEYWAELGKAVEHIIDLTDVYAVTQGIKKLSVEPVASEPVDHELIYNSIEINRENGSLAEKVTMATVYYESSINQPGMLDKVNRASGERQTGHFVDGKFITA